MSDTFDASTTDGQRETLAAAFGQNTDPLAEHAPTFERTDVDPFALFEADVLDQRTMAKNTRAQYEVFFRQWREFMAEQGRHPACPNEGHVKAFARYDLTERENVPDTVKEKLRKLGMAYEYWQADPSFPHPQDYNPVSLARSKLSFEDPEEKDPPRIALDTLRDRVAAVKNVRGRAIIVPQLKLGLRATELCNITIPELTIENAEVRDHYDEMGTHEMLDGRENAVYIPHDREGNKSQRPRVLPLDDETRRALLRWLLVRPDNGEPWMLLSHNQHEKIGKQAVNDTWKDAFHPVYAETERHRAVTSHYGRHYFTTFWTVEQEVNRELVKYMRGDTTSRSTEARIEGPPGAIETYIHTYYEDIESLYRDRIFKLGV